MFVLLFSFMFFVCKLQTPKIKFPFRVLNIISYYFLIFISNNTIAFISFVGYVVGHTLQLIFCRYVVSHTIQYNLTFADTQPPRGP